jgi:hypothetical protein
MKLGHRVTVCAYRYFRFRRSHVTIVGSPVTSDGGGRKSTNRTKYDDVWDRCGAGQHMFLILGKFERTRWDRPILVSRTKSHSQRRCKKGRMTLFFGSCDS